jgi:hypothetical protein
LISKPALLSEVIFFQILKKLGEKRGREGAEGNG